MGSKHKRRSARRTAKRSTKRHAKRQAKHVSHRARKAHPHVIIYTTQTCPFCKMAKELLEHMRVPFIEKDVQQDRRLGEEMVHKSGQMGVPVLDINGHIIIGYDKEAILKALR